MAIKYLPEKFNEIIRILFNKEMRIYLPIEELNLLLEPIPNPGDEDKELVEDEEIEAYLTDSSTSQVTSENEIDDEDEDDEDDGKSLVLIQSDTESHSSAENSKLILD